jgi:hypothetical protein
VLDLVAEVAGPITDLVLSMDDRNLFFPNWSQPPLALSGQALARFS